MTREEYNLLFHKEQLNLVAFKRLMDCDEEVLRLVNRAIEHERKKIKHFLTATSVSVQTRVYIGDEEISMLKMTHEEIRARGQE